MKLNLIYVSLIRADVFACSILDAHMAFIGPLGVMTRAWNMFSLVTGFFEGTRESILHIFWA